MDKLLNSIFDLDSEFDLKNLDLELNNIENNPIKKRIKRELKDFKNNCSTISITYNDNNNYKVYNKYLLTITVTDKLYKNNIYSFIIDVDYPFKPPKVEINFINYYVFLRIPVRFSNYLHKVCSFDCLCCNTITCHANWSPGYTINHIILEIRKYQKYKKNMIYKFFLDKIKNKYLIDDINLDSWLY